MTEEWRAIPGFEGSYEVSDQGRVRSLDRILQSPGAPRGYPKPMRGRMLKTQRHSMGYDQVNVAGETKLVGAMVLEAFVGPRPERKEVCHNNGKRDCSILTNLRWDTHVDNMADRVEHGTHYRGERNPGVKLTEQQVKEIRAREGVSFHREIADDYGVTRRLIGRILDRTLWPHV